MKPIRDCVARNFQFSNAQEECEKDTAAVLVPKKEEREAVSEQASRRSSPSRHVKALSTVDLTTEEVGSLVCGHIKEGEVATLLSSGSYGVKVRTADGQIGWAYAGHFEVVNAKP